MLLQTAVDVGPDYLIARATGTDFHRVDSLKVNAALNVTTLGVGSTVAKLRHLGKVAFLAKEAAAHADEAAEAARALARTDEAVDTLRGVKTAAEAAEAGRRLLPFTADNFRENLRRLTGMSGEAIKGLEAHHVLPQEFRDKFWKEYGLNIDDPIFGSWVETRPPTLELGVQ